jgi:uroporphyrinogen decarboxylase
MNPTERIIAAIEGQELERVPTFSYNIDLGPAYQVLGFPKISDEKLQKSWFGHLVTSRFGMGWVMRAFMKAKVKRIMFTCVEAAVALGFDAALAVYFPSMTRFPTEHTLQDDWGSYNELTMDASGNGSFFYSGPKITTPEAYESWPYFPDPDKDAAKARKLFRELNDKFGDKICLCGDVVSEIYTRMYLTIGFENLVRYMRKKPDFIKKFINRIEEYAIKTTGAMMDAGIRVVLKQDDFAFKTGPMMNPKWFDEFWGPSYTRICQYVHDRKGKVLLHACGDNTEMFDYFIKWGFDGGHAFETTSNVDIFKEKRLHGDRFTIIGGMGVDYHLTTNSTAEEVKARTRELITRLGPGGRFILSNVHCLPTMDMEKFKVMLQADREFTLKK